MEANPYMILVESSDFILSWINARPPSQNVTQHQPNLGCTSRAPLTPPVIPYRIPVPRRLGYFETSQAEVENKIMFLDLQGSARLSCVLLAFSLRCKIELPPFSKFLNWDKICTRGTCWFTVIDSKSVFHNIGFGLISLEILWYYIFISNMLTLLNENL